MFKNKLAIAALLVAMFGMTSSFEARKADKNYPGGAWGNRQARKCSCGASIERVKGAGKSDFCNKCRCGSVDPNDSAGKRRCNKESHLTGSCEYSPRGNGGRKRGEARK